jgi:hypothetical protein
MNNQETKQFRLLSMNLGKEDYVYRFPIVDRGKLQINFHIKFYR